MLFWERMVAIAGLRLLHLDSTDAQETNGQHPFHGIFLPYAPAILATLFLVLAGWVNPEWKIDHQTRSLQAQLVTVELVSESFLEGDRVLPFSVSFQSLRDVPFSHTPLPLLWFPFSLLSSTPALALVSTQRDCGFGYPQSYSKGLQGRSPIRRRVLGWVACFFPPAFLPLPQRFCGSLILLPLASPTPLL